MLRGLVEQIPWAAWKAHVEAKELQSTVQYLEVEGNLFIYAFDGEFTLRTVIGTHDPEASDYVEFMTDFAPLANQKIAPSTPDNRRMFAVNRIPPGFTVYPTGRGDDITGNVFAAGSRLKLDAATPSVDLQFLGHYYAIGGRIIWESADLDDEADGWLIAPATTAGTSGAGGSFTKVAVAPGAHIFVPTPAGMGDWNLDLSAKLGASQVLACTPVPAPGNTGFFDYDSDTNTLSVNAAQQGSYNLFDFEIKLFRFASAIFGRKQDGAESVLEASDVVGKLLYNTWKIRFTLTTLSGLARAGIVLNTAMKRNT